VTWIIFKNPIEASKEQVERFLEVLGMQNNRPIQPLNSRIVLD
jgi:carbonic anhydrase